MTGAAVEDTNWLEPEKLYLCIAPDCETDRPVFQDDVFRAVTLPRLPSQPVLPGPSQITFRNSHTMWVLGQWPIEELHACRCDGLRQLFGELACRGTGDLHPVGHSGWVRFRSCIRARTCCSSSTSPRAKSASPAARRS